eukprot:4166109-Pyramimonas_sp.AAC.1
MLLLPSCYQGLSKPPLHASQDVNKRDRSETPITFRQKHNLGPDRRPSAGGFNFYQHIKGSFPRFIGQV